MNNTDDNDYYQSLFESQQDEYQALGEQQESEIEVLIEQFESQLEYQQEEYQAIAEQQESEIEGLIEQFEQREEGYQAMGEQQENDIQALIDQYESQLFSANPSFTPTYQKESDDWFIINEDFSIEQSDNAPSNANLLFTIHKKLNRKSNSGKTPYFSYHILDSYSQKTNLKIGNYSCMDSATENWTSWEFNNNSIGRTDYLRAKKLNEIDYYDSKHLLFPIEYSFAELIQLDQYNPFNFNFNRLNFLKHDSKTTSGDKFARIKIIGSNNQFLVLSIFNFENNIIDLLKQLNDSTSFSEFHLKSHLTLAVKYLSHMTNDICINSNTNILNSYSSIVAHIKNVIDDNYKFLNKGIKENKESDINTLLARYDILKTELDSYINKF